jgi:hypothetical protein
MGIPFNDLPAVAIDANRSTLPYWSNVAGSVQAMWASDENSLGSEKDLTRNIRQRNINNAAGLM